MWFSTIMPPTSTPKVRDRLARHLRFTLHFTPTSCSWANAVEGWFAKPTWQRLKRGAFTSIVELQTAINRFIADANRQAQAVCLDQIL
jgi:hypothetical protein